MPRKNLKRKNSNSGGNGGGGNGGGRRRKSKPIKFNPNDIENEQKLMLGASIEKDNDDDDAEAGDNTATIVIEMDANDDLNNVNDNDNDNVERQDNEYNIKKMIEQEMQSINGSESIQVNRNNSDMATTVVAASSNSGIDNACPSNQMNKIVDGVQNEDDATATVMSADSITKRDGAVKSDNLLSNRTFNYYHFRFVLFSFFLRCISFPLIFHFTLCSFHDFHCIQFTFVGENEKNVAFLWRQRMQRRIEDTMKTFKHSLAPHLMYSIRVFGALNFCGIRNVFFSRNSCSLRSFFVHTFVYLRCSRSTTID